MDQQNEEVHVSTEDARAGETGQGVRYVLMVSLVLVVAALAAIFLFGTSGPEREGTAPIESSAPAPATT